MGERRGGLEKVELSDQFEFFRRSKKSFRFIFYLNFYGLLDAKTGFVFFWFARFDDR